MKSACDNANAILVAEPVFDVTTYYQAGVAELADARDLGSRSLTEYRFKSDHPHH
jgi:hypothetical protein